MSGAPTRLLVQGHSGRMGQTIARFAPEFDCAVTATVGRGDDLRAVSQEWDVAVDFSIWEATAALADTCAHSGKALVIGTTGHSSAARAEITKSSSGIAVVWSGNFSVGVNLLFHLTRKAASSLPLEYNPEIVEMHHKHKRDAPSGTAEHLIDIVREERGLAGDLVRHGRHGIPGERPAAEIGVHALRGGDTVGEHTVYFAGSGERLELRHIATDRAIFGQGALRAAKWVLGRSPGIYTMTDVLGLE